MANQNYKQNTAIPSDELYKSREFYKQNAFAGLPVWRIRRSDGTVVTQPDRMKNTVEEKMLVHPYHGRIDKDGDAIYLVLPRQTQPETNILVNNPIYKQDMPSTQQQIPAITELKSANSSTKLYVPIFIAKAFFDMNSYYKDGLLTGKLEKNGVYSPLAPMKAIVNYEIEYKKYFNKLLNEFEQYLKTNKLYKDIINIEDYTEQFVTYIENQYSPVVTSSRYILSQHSDPAISGLSLFITTDDHNDDLNKYKTYIDNNNFNFFLESCTRFGFMVNANAPWELYFHFNSEPAKQYLERYGINSEEDLYGKLYKKAFYNDIRFLKNYILKRYNAYAKENKEDIFCNKLNRCGEPIIEKINRSPVSIEQLEKQIDEKKWLEYYFTIRLKEERIDLQYKLKQTVLREANILNGDNSLRYINNYILSNKETIDLRKIQNY